MLDVTSIIRSLAITFIVAGHLMLLPYGGGGAVTLMLLAGFTYSKYIIPSLPDKRKSNLKHVLLLLKIAIPAIGYLFAQQLVSKNGFQWSVVALVSNYVSPVLNGAWFIEIYLQINLVLLILVQSDFIRSSFSKLGSYVPAVGFFLGATVISLFTDVFWNTDELYDRVPNHMLWFFSAGVLLSASKTTVQKLGFVAAVMLAVWLTPAGRPQPFLLLAVLILPFVQTVRFPSGGIWLIKRIAGASLMIYLTHFLSARLLQKAWVTAPTFLGVIFALVAGIVIQEIYGRVWHAWKSKHVNQRVV